jgi:hypothetical protein
MSVILYLCYLVHSTAYSMTMPVAADIRLTPSGTLKATPSRFHEAKDPAIEIFEKETCSTQHLSKTELRIQEPCGFLSGVFRYQFAPKAGGPVENVVVGFSYAKASGVGSHILRVEPSMTLP